MTPEKSVNSILGNFLIYAIYSHINVIIAIKQTFSVVWISKALANAET